MNGCRCDDCTAANRAYFQQRRNDLIAPVADSGPGPVETAVQEEIGASAAELRPGLTQVALALARNVMDNPKAVNQHSAAAKVLASLLDKLGTASARGRRGYLTSVRTMTGKGDAPGA